MLRVLFGNLTHGLSASVYRFAFLLESGFRNSCQTIHDIVGLWLEFDCLVDFWMDYPFSDR